MKKLFSKLYETKLKDHQKDWKSVSVTAFWSCPLSKKGLKYLIRRSCRSTIEDAVAYIPPRVFIYHMGKRFFLKEYPNMRPDIRDIFVFKGGIHLAKQRDWYDRYWLMLKYGRLSIYPRAEIEQIFDKVTHNNREYNKRCEKLKQEYLRKLKNPPSRQISTLKFPGSE